ncbi:MAG: leucyl/phenylalanyl-tRNA--protein transferase [Cloacibacterium sp.]|jgi:leucyl/phenylalanyl-tRNA--protein transferase|nr:leucyl/phenylalanyl-tRNA--protein transferase [Cloacibacterium sp.]
MILLNKDEIAFPDPSLYHPQEGIMAIGGDLSPERLKWAYQLGIFPWFNEGEEILWWCPDPRFVLFPREIKVSKSMRKILQKECFSFTENVCFEEVIKNCAQINRKNQQGTWISDEIIASYTLLHQQSIAKSIEVWQNENLVGGFYGIEVGSVFCGESMFSKVSNASKAAFIYFVEKYKNKYQIIDCQVHTNHLESLGARMISKQEYLHFLKTKT